MSITDELRKWAEDNTLQDRVPTAYPPPYAVHGALETLLRITDRIDAEHERAVRYERCAFWHDASDDELAHYGLLRAPIDADGVTWRIGDRDENGNIVTAIKLATDGFWINVGCIYRLAETARHYQPDTWERIINDAIVLGVEQEEGKVGFDAYSNQCEDLIARCKALAGDAE